MIFKKFVLLVFGILIIYLIYKTRNLEKLTKDIPIMEQFEYSVENTINNKFSSNINNIRNLSNLINELYSSIDSVNISANTMKIKDIIVKGTINITNKDNMYLNIFPKYMIIVWADATPPKGWAICDGNRYSMDKDGNIEQDIGGTLTPDLRGRFILGAGINKNNTKLTERKVGEIGGEENHELTLNEIPAHAHNFIMDNQNFRHSSGSKTDYFFYKNDHIKTTLNAGGNLKPNTGKKIDGADKDYDDTAQFTTTPHNNMPPFNVLIYIMKL